MIRAIRNIIRTIYHAATAAVTERLAIGWLCMLMVFPYGYFSPEARAAALSAPSPAVTADDDPRDRKPLPRNRESDLQEASAMQDSTVFADTGLAIRLPEEQDSTVVQSDSYPYGLDGKIPFNPSPARAVWLSALCPGLGQIYNRRYWKLPIVVGGFMGLAYATSWNNNQYQDYIQGFRDLTDSDPGTNSYMDFFPPTVNEADLDTSWLTSTFRSRKDYYRRNRDLCIICLVAMYLVCMLDAYVDASLAHFDISPDLSMDVAPALMVQPQRAKPTLGLSWAFNF